MELNKEMMKDNETNEFKDFCKKVGDYFDDCETSELCKLDPLINLAFTYKQKENQNLKQQVEIFSILVGEYYELAPPSFEATIEKALEKIKALETIEKR